MSEQSDHANEYQPQWGRSTRTIVAVFLALGVIAGLSLILPVLQMLLIAFLIAFVMLLPARALTTHLRLPYAISVVLSYIVLLAVGLIVVLVLIPPFINGVTGLVNDVGEGIAVGEAWLVEYEPGDAVVEFAGIQLDLDAAVGPLHDFITGPAAIEMGIDLSDVLDELPPPEPDDDAAITPTQTPSDIETTGDTPGSANPRDVTGILGSSQLGQILSGALNVAGIVTTTVTSTITSITGLMTTLLLATFISFLVLLDLPSNQASIARMVPKAYQRECAILFERIERVWSGFFRGQMTIGLVIGILTLIQLRLMGVPGAEILAVFTGVISLIPTLGGFIALIPLAIVPLVQGSLVFTDMSHFIFMLLVVGVNLLISQVIWNIVAPKILGDALDLPLPVIIVGVFVGAAAGGVMGAFLVAPVMSMLRVIIVYLIHKINGSDPFPGQQPVVPLGNGFFGRAHLARKLAESSAKAKQTSEETS